MQEAGDSSEEVRTLWRRTAVYRFERLINAIDADLAEHGRRTGRLAGDIAEVMNLDTESIADLDQAAFLHDIGKLFIPRTILDKPGPLDTNEWAELRHHPRMGYQLVAGEVSDKVARIVLTHHERFDGTGYPQGLTGRQVPIEAQILQVADAFDAITSDRPYQPALPVAYALNEMRRCSGSQFDPDVVDAVIGLAGQAKWILARFGQFEKSLQEVAV